MACSNTSARAWVAAILAAVATPFAAFGQVETPGSTPFLAGRFSDSVTRVAPGVDWHRMVNSVGPFVVNLVTVNLKTCRCELRGVRAKDSLVAREKVSAMVARQPEGVERVLAAINADFFDVKTGENENNQVIGGEWWKGVRVTDSPYDAFDNAHAQFAIDTDGRPRMDRYAFNGTVLLGYGRGFPLTALNHLERQTLEAAVLYTDRMGTTPADTVRPMSEVTLRSVMRRNDTTAYVVAGPAVKSGGHAIPPGAVILAAYGPRSRNVATLKTGDTIAVALSAAAAQGEGARLIPRLLIGGWPRILTDGQLSAHRAPWDEGTLSSNAEARHPRSAIGFSRDSSTVYVVTVDGRSEDSGGMTLVELALFLQSQGAANALNFDGGGSSTMVVKGRVVNAPSDKEGERPVGNALLIVARH